MKVVFVENRGKTSFWAKIARSLQKDGYSVNWIVQNPIYAPPSDVGIRFNIGFPDIASMVDAPIPAAVQTDRGRQYFDAGSRHYSFYRVRISQALDHFKPDVVIGEPTLMHELLTIAECRARGIPYIHPTMTRYPGGRFNVLDGDTQVPVIGSGETFSDSSLSELAEAIATGSSLPSYMKKPRALAAKIRRLRRLIGQMRVSMGWIVGERFNTPSPLRKMALHRLLNKNLAEWTNLAQMPDGTSPVILYPLQMQPEANIDVWGRPYSDQMLLIQRLLNALPEYGAVAVKANPKSRYEVSAELLALARTDRRIILLPLDCTMNDAQKATIGAVTVSGTVGLEAVFGRGRCLSLRHPVLERHLPAFHSKTPEDAVGRLLADSHAGRGSVVHGAKLLAQLVADSFEGTINEPTYDPDCLHPENIKKVAGAITHVLQHLGPQTR